MILVDSAAIVELLLNTPTGLRCADRAKSESLHAPHLAIWKF